MPTPSKQKALILPGPKSEFEVQTIDTPKPGPGEILVKIRAVSLNPLDWKIQKFDFFVKSYPAIIGIDPVGDVEELGEGVTGVSVGDKVFFQAVLENRRAGFQQYVITKPETLAKIPSKVSYEEVATFPCAGGAAYCGLFNSPPHGMGIPNPLAGREREVGKAITILGASSIVGQYAIQFANLAGFSPIIAHTSMQHADNLRSLGATHVVNRAASPDQIQKEVDQIIGGQSLQYVFDTISIEGTQQLGYNLLSSAGGHLAVTLSDKVKNKVENKKVCAVAVARDLPENREDLIVLYGSLNALLNTGAIKPSRYEVLPHGLAGIPNGLERMENGKVSGFKLVARPQETG